MKFLKYNIKKHFNFNECKSKFVYRKINTFLFVSKIVLHVCVLFLGVNVFSQDVLYSDHNVACLGFSNGGNNNNPIRGIVFNEYVQDDPSGEQYCIKVCEYKEVNYYFDEFSQIESVSWEIEGGELIDNWEVPQHKALVRWGETGYGTLILKIKYPSGNSSTRTICVEIIEAPKAEFKLETIGDEKKYCTNAPISFDNLSQGGIHFLWDFGDDSYSSEFEPEHTYLKGGVYNVTLTVINNCNCENTYSLEIYIEAHPPTLISCPAIVCENDRISYSVKDSCPGDWIVEGGHIINGGDGVTFIEVVWNNVEPKEGFGYIHYRSRCGCPFWTTVKIPVVTRRSEIQGNNVVCVGKQERYTLPQWATTDFQWSLVTDTDPPQLVLLDQRNEVIIDGLTPGDYTLICKYKNTLLGCEGVAEKQIRIVPKIEIVGENIFCLSTQELRHFTTTSGENVNWTLFIDGILIGQQLDKAVSEFLFYGYTAPYTLIASSESGCESDPFEINVFMFSDTSFPPIKGVDKVCVGHTYVYECTDDMPGTMLVWSVIGDATIQGSNTGNTVNIKYNGGGSYQIKVERVTIGNAIFCELNTEQTLDVKEIDFDFNMFSNSGESVFCPGSTSYFTADFYDLVPDYIVWNINPANKGSIINGINSNEITVIWNEVSENTSGTITIDVMYCGVKHTKEFPFKLFQTPEISIADIPKICPEISTIDVAVTVVGIESGTLLFDFGNNTTQTKTFNNSGTTLHTINNLFTNDSATDITQFLEVKLLNPNGCPYSPSAVAEVTVFPKTTITLFPQVSNIQICPSEAFSYGITSNFSTGVTGSESFQWFKNNVPINGSTTLAYTINNATQPSPAGTYKLRVIDKNNCIVYSPEINVTENCLPPTPPSCSITPNPNVKLTGNWDSCTIFSTQLSYDYPPDAIMWTTYTDVQIQSGQGTPSAIFTSDIAGLHTISATLTYGECSLTYTIPIPKNYQPGLSIGAVCNNDGTYNLTLYNNSMVYDPDNILNIKYNYYEGIVTDPNNPDTSSIGTEDFVEINGEIPPGTHSYTLIVFSEDNPICAISQTITLGTTPVPNDFIISEAPYCPNEVISLTFNDFKSYPDYVFTWYFSDNTSVIASEATTSVSFSENVGIKLSITTPMGCVLESDIVEIKFSEQSSFSGKVLPEEVVFCENNISSGIYFENTGDFAPTKVIWMNGDQVAGEGFSFIPTKSGIYWVMLENENGCRFANTEDDLYSSNVTIIKPPYVDIIGDQTLCFGETTILEGKITDNNLQRRWLLNGEPVSGAYGMWSNNTPLSLEIEGNISGGYKYTLEVRSLDGLGCDNEAVLELTVYPPTSVPEFVYEVLSCEPYTVLLTVVNILPGQYNWSNGATEPKIVVNIGGAYRVTYTDLNGCSEIYERIVPHHVDRYMWVFPTGCYNLCRNNNWHNPYIIGPLPNFEQHHWMVNNNSKQQAQDIPVQDFYVNNNTGVFELHIKDEICKYISQPAYISECGVSIIAPSPITLNKTEKAKKELSVEFSEDLIDEFSVIPNPSNTTVTLSYNFETYYHKTKTIKIYTIDGRLIADVNLKPENTSVVLDVSTWSSGTYIVNFIVDDIVVKHRKLVKN